MTRPDVRQLRVVITAEDFDEALRFYRDELGLVEETAVASPGGRVAILNAGRATLEIADRRTAEYIDHVEVGRRVAGAIRFAFEVSDVRGVTLRLAEAGAVLLAEPRHTPFKSTNARIQDPAGLQLTLFERDIADDDT
jgi:lactoylglutathione lyase